MIQQSVVWTENHPGGADRPQLARYFLFFKLSVNATTGVMKLGLRANLETFWQISIFALSFHVFSEHASINAKNDREKLLEIEAGIPVHFLSTHASYPKNYVHLGSAVPPTLLSVTLLHQYYYSISRRVTSLTS